MSLGGDEIMTLILGAIVDSQSVILAADSRIDGRSGPPPFATHEKMFVRTQVGILTSGSAQGLDVPAIIQTGLPPNADLQAAIIFMRREFGACADMHSIVGGLDGQNQARLFRINRATSDELKDPAPKLWRSFGAGVDSVDLTHPAHIGLTLDQMRNELRHARSRPGIGPPFKYLIISPA